MPSRIFSLIAMALLLTATVWAQAVAVAEISGQVTDSSGAIVPGAQIRVIQTETQYTRSATADALGNYTLVNLPVGPYTLEVKADGFKTFVQSGSRQQSAD